MSQTLFPVKYHHAHIHNHKQVFGSLLQSAEHLLSNTNGRWNCELQTTYFDEKDVVHPEELGTVLAPYLYQYFPNWSDIEILNSWLNLYNSGCHQEPHHHIQFPEFINFSGVVFIQYNPETDAKFYFENMNLDHTISGYTQLFQQSPIMDLSVKEGDIIVFPSFVRHGVHMQKSDTNRLTLSFNMCVRPMSNPPNAPEFP
jgi:hypothetical protein